MVLVEVYDFHVNGFPLLLIRRGSSSGLKGDNAQQYMKLAELEILRSLPSGNDLNGTKLG